MRRTGFLMTSAALTLGLSCWHALAQEQMPAYIVVEVNIHDAERFQRDYAEHLTGTVEQYGGTFIIRGGPHETLVGAEPDGNVVVLRFHSTEAAKKFLGSPEYAEIAPVRRETATTRAYLIEGMR
jgi:uncharacterized protein (DUF1330 family)